MRWASDSPVFVDDFRFSSNRRWKDGQGSPGPSLPFVNTKRKFASIAVQGVATDGSHILATNDTLCRKYDMAGNIVGEIAHGMTGWKYEDFCIVDGVAFVPITNYPNTPRQGRIQMVDVATMTQIGDKIDLNESTWPAAMAHKDGMFWLSVTESDVISVYDFSFDLQATYQFQVIGEQSTRWPGYSGLEWIGDYLFGNKHSGAGRGIDVVRYDSGSDSLIAVGAFDSASPGTTQGMTHDPINNKVYWAARGHSNEVWESTVNQQWFK